MAAASPRALREAVLPPVLGPVSMTTLAPAGTQKSTGWGALALACARTRWFDDDLFWHCCMAKKAGTKT